MECIWNVLVVSRDLAFMFLTALQRRPDEINQRASDMWSFAVLLWELATREVPFADLSPMEVGMKVCCRGDCGIRLLGQKVGHLVVEVVHLVTGPQCKLQCLMVVLCGTIAKKHRWVWLAPLVTSCVVATYFQVALEGLRVSIPPGTPAHMTRMVKICMNEDPGKRPRFDMVIPILEKMKGAGWLCYWWITWLLPWWW